MSRLLFAVLLLAACGGSDDKDEHDLSALVTDLSGTSNDAGSSLKGPGASLQCESSGMNAFMTYGATAIVAVNERIFANVNADITTNGPTNLGSSFSEVGTGTPASTSDGPAVFKGKLGAFLIWAYGGPSTFQYTDGIVYQGIEDLTQAHTGLEITSLQYDYFVSNIVAPALTASGVHGGSGDDFDDVSSCFAPVLTDPTFSASIIGH